MPCFVAGLPVLGWPAPATAQTTAAPTTNMPTTSAPATNVSATAAPNPVTSVGAVRVLINDAPPYRIVTRNAGGPSYSGIYVDIMRRLAEETRLTLAFIETPYARGFAMMQGGDADIMLGPNRTAERERYLLYLDPPLPAEPKAFLTRQNGPSITRYEDLRGLRIAVLRGARYFDRFDHDPDLQKLPVADYESALRLLAGRRADVAIMPELQANWHQRHLQFDLRIAPWRVPGEPSHIALARNSPLAARAPELQAALRRLQQNGTITQILRLYS